MFRPNRLTEFLHGGFFVLWLVVVSLALMVAGAPMQAQADKVAQAARNDKDTITLP
jgi:hypothetical protein